MAKPPPSGSAPPTDELLAVAGKLAGRSVDIVAVDIPLSRQPITGRRPADNKVTSKFIANWAGTHSPSRDRPGAISDRLRADLESAGYALATQAITGRLLIEVYPHVALLRLAKRDERLPYKVGKIYSRTDSAAVRRAALYATWREILALLETKIAGVSAAIGPLIPAVSTRRLKAAEDMLDAVVCAWVGIEALSGRADHLGDESSAIWFPRAAS